MKLNRNIIVKTSHTSIDSPSHLPAEHLLSNVWQLTQEIYSLTGNFNAKSRLQRDAISFSRKPS